MMRYPMMWEAVRTSWTPDTLERFSLANQLVEHVNHVLRNKYREQTGPPRRDVDDPNWTIVTTTAVNERASAQLDGVVVDAVEVDTDPFVYGVGFWLRPDVAVTAVLPRDDLPHLDQSFVTTEPPN